MSPPSFDIFRGFFQPSRFFRRPTPPVQVSLTVEEWRVVLRFAGLGLTARTPPEEWAPVVKACDQVRKAQGAMGLESEVCEVCGLVVESLRPGERRCANVCRTCTARQGFPW